MLFALAVKGSIITVNNLNDSGAGSLRSAIASASAGDTIAFGVSGTIVLTGGQLNIGTNLTINGSGIVINGNAGNIFNLTGSASDTFSNLTLLNATDAITGSNTNSVSLLNSTISGNTTGLAGVIATVTDSTFSGNNIAINSGTVSLYDSTISGGTTGLANASLTIGNSIIDGNTADFGTGNTITDLGDNLIGSGGGFTNGVDGDIVGQNPLLGSLANNGGPTLTYALLAGSPAIDAGSNGLIPSGTTTDQRGPGFARISGTSVDIGAFEVQQSTPEPATYVTSILGLAILAVARVLWGGAMRCHLAAGSRKQS
jgi:hypothetical protein